MGKILCLFELTKTVWVHFKLFLVMGRENNNNNKNPQPTTETQIMSGNSEIKSSLHLVSFQVSESKLVWKKKKKKVNEVLLPIFWACLGQNCCRWALQRAIQRLLWAFWFQQDKTWYVAWHGMELGWFPPGRGDGVLWHGHVPADVTYCLQACTEQCWSSPLLTVVVFWGVHSPIDARVVPFVFETAALQNICTPQMSLAH